MFILPWGFAEIRTYWEETDQNGRGGETMSYMKLLGISMLFIFSSFIHQTSSILLCVIQGPKGQGLMTKTWCGSSDGLHNGVELPNCLKEVWEGLPIRVSFELSLDGGIRVWQVKKRGMDFPARKITCPKSQGSKLQTGNVYFAQFWLIPQYASWPITCFSDLLN